MDQHLVAEYREIFMIGSALVRSRASPNWEKNKQKWPSTFTLNTGHVKFFFLTKGYTYTSGTNN
jgi:deoxyribonuclease (pyrimidine dimer)